MNRKHFYYALAFGFIAVAIASVILMNEGPDDYWNPARHALFATGGTTILLTMLFFILSRPREIPDAEEEIEISYRVRFVGRDGPMDIKARTITAGDRYLCFCNQDGVVIAIFQHEDVESVIAE